jgi:hypothetical protein
MAISREGGDGTESLYNEGDAKSLRRVLVRLRESKVTLRLYRTTSNALKECCEGAMSRGIYALWFNTFK